VLAVILVVWSVANWGQRLYAQSHKNRFDKFYKVVNGVTRKLNAINDFAGLAQLEIVLNDIRQWASTELVEEKLAADEGLSYLPEYAERISGSTGENMGANSNFFWQLT